jgi:LacI family transcriptional regulator
MLGVAEVTDRTEYEVVLYMMSPTRKHSDVLDRILAMKLSMGMLAIMPGKLGPHLDYLSQQGVPIVTIEDQVAPINTPWIGIDNVDGAYEATRYLLSLGHRRIAHILGPEGYLCAAERYEGYSRALREAGLEVDPDLVWRGDFTVPGGRACAEQIFSRPSQERPEALFAANDQMAFGVMDAAPQYGVRIPDDLTLIGFDDMPITAFTKPGLTTIRQPHREMGALACELLLSKIDPRKHPFIPKNREYTIYQNSFQVRLSEENSKQAVFGSNLEKQMRGSETFLGPQEGDGKSLRILLPTKLIVRESCRIAKSVSRQVQ